MSEKVRYNFPEKDSYKVSLDSKIEGSLVFNNKIKENLAYLESIKPLVKKYGSYQLVLGGDSPYSKRGDEYNPDFFDFKAGIKAVGGRTVYVKRKGTMADCWDTVSDVDNFITKEYENRRYKFYLSVNTDLSKEESSAFLKDLYVMCKEKGVTLFTKDIESHVYDNNIYTYHPNEMAEILKGLYKKYKNIWFSTEHFFQGKLDGVDSKHIGYVQELALFTNMRVGFDIKGSHSDRIGMLGKVIDRGLASGRALDADLFKEACKIAKVQPDKPWLLDLSKDK